MQAATCHVSPRKFKGTFGEVGCRGFAWIRGMGLVTRAPMKSSERKMGMAHVEARQ